MIDGDSSNSFCDIGVEALWSVVLAQELKLDHWGQKFDCLDQAIIDLIWLIGYANMKHKKEMNVLGDMHQGQPYLGPIPEIPPTQPLVCGVW